MRLRHQGWLIGLTVLLAMYSNTTKAALINAGSDFVVDTSLSLTWMRDGNLAKTLCDAADPVFTGWSSTVDDTPADICLANGAMTWADAEAWVARLNSVNYLGFSDWRQPVAIQPDASCEAAPAYGFNCTGSELGHLFNISLANPNHAGTGATGGAAGTGCGVGGPVNMAPDQCLQNLAGFQNVWSPFYWTGSTMVGIPVNAVSFSMARGEQQNGSKLTNRSFVWLVRSGMVSVPSEAVPIAPVGFYFSMMLFLIYFARKKLVCS